MKKINIFKSGTHRDSNGTTMDFSESKLAAAVSAYDPAIHEAPIVIGHPKGDNPAYGWIKSLEFNEADNKLFAEPHQLNADFEEMVANHAFKKVSASWYLPEHPANPVPGSLYLRHVGFLGAQPPAIKGLDAINFEEADSMIVEFEESWEDGWNMSAIAGIFKSMREFIIDKFSKEEADAIIPNYAIDDIKRSADRKIDKANEQVTANPLFNEENSMETLEQAKTRIAALEAEQAATQGENDKLKGRIANFEEADLQRNKQAMAARVDALVTSGFIAPAQKAATLAFCEKLDLTATVEFGEGDSKTTQTMVEAYLSQFNKKIVNFNEQSEEDSDPPAPQTAQGLTVQALEYQEEQRKHGRQITIVTAIQELENKESANA